MMDLGYGRQGWNGLAEHRGIARLLSGDGTDGGTAQILFDTRLLGYRLEEMWTFARSSERDRAARLGTDGFLLRRGRRVIRILEGPCAIMERVRDEIFVEERELGHAQSVYLGAWLPKEPLFGGNGLRIIEPDEGAFRDLLSVTPPYQAFELLEPEALRYLIDRMYVLVRAGMVPHCVS
ncbi:MAG: hypothetical protein K9H25_11480 [Rhodospirillum sp.]|nr:hypothetical protein [Rhodospirillum sp.]MCF8489825.1 hypothetical protein [Rhodospirillum sp.]MCF8501065.1 hypothetical protein [Rhodospirillum sp.]